MQAEVALLLRESGKRRHLMDVQLGGFDIFRRLRVGYPKDPTLLRLPILMLLQVEPKRLGDSAGVVGPNERRWIPRLEILEPGVRQAGLVDQVLYGPTLSFAQLPETVFYGNPGHDRSCQSRG